VSHDKKEKEIFGHIEIVMGDSLKELDSYERILSEKLTTINNNVKYIKENMANGAQATLSFYADNNKILYQAVEQEVKTKDQYISQLLARNQQLDADSLRNLKEGINSVSDAISKLRVAPMSRAAPDKKEGLLVNRGSQEEAAIPEEFS